jgi:hypothetical protein
VQHGDRPAALEGAQPIDVLGPEGEGFSDMLRSALLLLHLEANGKIAGQQPEADRDAVGMEGIADQPDSTTSLASG